MISALLFTVEKFEDSSCSRTFLYGRLLKENSVEINGKSSHREFTSRVPQWPVVGHRLLNVSPSNPKRSREVARPELMKYIHTCIYIPTCVHTLD